jgi:hypothetical protein
MNDFVSRRNFLFESGGGLSGVALAWLLNQQGLLAAGSGTGNSGACRSRSAGSAATITPGQ